MVSGFERFRATAEELGVAVEPLRYPAGTRTAADAAAAVGCDVGQIVKSLVFATPTKLVLALTSGANQVDTDRLGELAGEEISLADPEAVRACHRFCHWGNPAVRASQSASRLDRRGLAGLRRRVGCGGNP